MPENHVAVLRELRSNFYWLAVHFDNPGSAEKSEALSAAITALESSRERGEGTVTVAEGGAFNVRWNDGVHHVIGRTFHLVPATPSPEAAGGECCGANLWSQRVQLFCGLSKGHEGPHESKASALERLTRERDAQKATPGDAAREVEPCYCRRCHPTLGDPSAIPPATAPCQGRTAPAPQEGGREGALTASMLADALGCFWNAALGADICQHNADARAAAGAIAEGFAAVETRLREFAGLAAHQQRGNGDA